MGPKRFALGIVGQIPAPDSLRPTDSLRSRATSEVAVTARMTRGSGGHLRADVGANHTFTPSE